MYCQLELCAVLFFSPKAVQDIFHLENYTKHCLDFGKINGHKF